MELKYKKVAETEKIGAESSNRTFMELKFSWNFLVISLSAF